MSEAQTSAPATTAPATPPAAPPATAPPPTPDARAQTEALAASQKARRLEKELDQVRREAGDLKKALEGADPAKRAEALRTAPWAALMEAFPGMSKADITKALLGAGKKPDPQEETAREVAALKKRLDEEKARREQEAHAGRANAVLSHCLGLAKADLDKYELVADAMESDPARWQATLLDYEKRFPDNDAHQALQEFEAVLLQREQRRARLRKVQALHGQAKTDPKAKEKPATEGNAGSPRTLTQGLASERATPATGRESPLRSKEREAAEAREAAIAAFVATRGGG